MPDGWRFCSHMLYINLCPIFESLNHQDHQQGNAHHPQSCIREGAQFPQDICLTPACLYVFRCGPRRHRHRKRRFHIRKVPSRIDECGHAQRTHARPPYNFTVDSCYFQKATGDNGSSWKRNSQVTCKQQRHGAQTQAVWRQVPAQVFTSPRGQRCRNALRYAFVVNYYEIQTYGLLTMLQNLNVLPSYHTMKFELIAIITCHCSTGFDKCRLITTCLQGCPKRFQGLFGLFPFTGFQSSWGRF